MEEITNQSLFVANCFGLGFVSRVFLWNTLSGGSISDMVRVGTWAGRFRYHFKPLSDIHLLGTSGGPFFIR